ncbi:MAG: DUF5723 family protein [Rikenellaceae bacterium]
MKPNKIISIIIFIFYLSTITHAQILRSVYFINDNPTRHELNPAFSTNKGYIGIPMISNFGVSIASNMKLSSILFPTAGGNLTTFLDKNIDENRVLNQFKNKNVIDGRLNLSLLSTGFHKWGGFNTAAINIKGYTTSSIPYDLFALAKSGMNSVDGNNYDLTNTRHTTDTYAELAFGHSREVAKGVNVGAKIKVLFGVMSMSAKYDQFNATLTQDKWEVSSSGVMDVAGATLSTDETGEIIGIDKVNYGINGMGMAFDIGVSWEVANNLTISASALDLGFIKWNKNIRANTSGEPFMFDGFKDISVIDENAPNSLQNQFDGLTDDLQKLYAFYQTKTGVKTTRQLPSTLNVGIEYCFARNKLTTGLLSTTGFSREYIWTELMLSANYHPVNWFTFGLNGSWSTLGCGYGAIINFTTRGFNFFAGANTSTMRYTPQAVPIGHATIYANIGFNVMLKRNYKTQRWN